MNKAYSNYPFYSLFILIILLYSCEEQNQTFLPIDSQNATGISSNLSSGYQEAIQLQNSSNQLPISDFVRRIFQDENGDLWFGTNGDGVIRYNGDSLEYFSIDEGFSGTAVRGIVEDKNGDVWFATSGGISKYKPTAKNKTKLFTNFTEEDGLINNDVWSIYIDSKNEIWIGTYGGISRFNGETFSTFEIPETKPDDRRGVTSSKIVHCIMEDSKGKMWFGSNDAAFIYDGKTLSALSEKDGLSNNSVNCILEDKEGSIWFATHFGGISRYDGSSFSNFTLEGEVSGIEVWSIFEDKKGNIWFPSEGFGVYRYDGKSFTNFHEKEGLPSHAIQCIYEDKNDRIWLGGWMGLFRFDGDSIYSVNENGPWD